MLTWFIVAGGALLLAGTLLFSFQRKQPDQLILIEKKGHVVQWNQPFFPKRICLALPNMVNSFTTEVKTLDLGKIEALVKLSVSFYADPENLSNLIRTGGWTPGALKNIEQELEGSVQGIVGSVVENLAVTEFKRELIARNIREKLSASAANAGVKISSVTVISADPVDSMITEAIKKQEEARIQENAERTLQASRTLQAELKAQADQKIAQAEHDVAMKKLALQKIREAGAAELARAAVEQQSERRKLELEIEKKEVEIFAQNPALLLLAPQLTRLTEASQQLKNAETVITFSSELFNKLPQPLQEIFKLLERPPSIN